MNTSKQALLSVILAVSIGNFCSAQVQPKKLNVLFIIADDLCADLGCYGAPLVSPNLDRLAARGTRFDRAYCQYPLCGPSRASILSGLRPNTEGVLGNDLPVRHKLPDLVTLPQCFRQNGYFVARVGKLYHLNIPGGVGTPGPDDPASWDHTFNPKGAEFTTDGEVHDPNPRNGQSFRRVMGKGDGAEQADYQSADEAIRLLRQHKDRPFFLAVGFIRPHVPEIAPKKYFDLYAIDQIKLPIVPPDDRDDIPAMALQQPKGFNFGMNEEDCRESKRAYYATTSFMDAQAGRVIDEMDRLGLAGNTVIVFLSDHGYLLGQHGEWQKLKLFEPVCRVPLIIARPGARQASCSAPVELIDLYPTLTDLCQLKPPPGLDGKSLAPLLDRADAPANSAAFTQITLPRRQGYSVRTDRFRYTEWGDQGSAGVELFDEQKDPDEFTNLAKDPQHEQIVAQHRRLLHQQFPATMPSTQPAN